MACTSPEYPVLTTGFVLGAELTILNQTLDVACSCRQGITNMPLDDQSLILPGTASCTADLSILDSLVVRLQRMRHKRGVEADEAEAVKFVSSLLHPIGSTARTPHGILTHGVFGLVVEDGRDEMASEAECGMDIHRLPSIDYLQLPRIGREDE